MDEVLSLHMGAPENDAEGSIGKALRAKSNIARRPPRSARFGSLGQEGSRHSSESRNRESRAIPLAFWARFSPDDDRDFK